MESPSQWFACGYASQRCPRLNEIINTGTATYSVQRKKNVLSEPLPHGDLRVEMRNFLVGNRTGPFVFNSFSLERLIKSWQTSKSRSACFAFDTVFQTRMHTLLEVLNVTRGQRDTNLVDLDFHLLFVAGLHVALGCLVRHGIGVVVDL